MSASAPLSLPALPVGAVPHGRVAVLQFIADRRQGSHGTPVAVYDLGEGLRARITDSGGCFDVLVLQANPEYGRRAVPAWSAPYWVALSAEELEQVLARRAGLAPVLPGRTKRHRGAG